MMLNGVKHDICGQSLHPTYHRILFEPPLLQLTILDLHKNHSTPSPVHGCGRSPFSISLPLYLSHTLCLLSTFSCHINFCTGSTQPLCTSHTRLSPVTITLQALSLVKKVELVQVRFTLRLREQWSK